MSTVKANTYQDASGGSNAILYGAASPAGSMGFRNRIINGDMRIDQRNAGASTTLTAGAVSPGFQYTLDRWTAYCTGASLTYQRVAGSGSYQYALRFTGASSNSGLYFEQRIESLNTYDIASKTCTLKATISSNALTSITWKAFYANSADAFGTASSPTKTQIDTGTFTITSTDTEYSVQISMPASAVNGVAIQFSVGSLGSGQTLTITGVQLEVGSVATEFERRPYGTELALCQRYYYKTNTAAASQLLGNGTNWSGSTAQFLLVTPVPLRTTPSMSLVGTITATGYGASGGQSFTMSSLGSVGTLNGQSVQLPFFATMSGSFGGYTHVYWYNDNTSSYLSISAEL